jgi:hypothetical protein
MATIEVTKETFYKLFKGDPKSTQRTETNVIDRYFNSKLNQSGLKIWNHVSSKVHQYYLIDINA